MEVADVVAIPAVKNMSASQNRRRADVGLGIIRWGFTLRQRSARHCSPLEELRQGSDDRKKLPVNEYQSAALALIRDR